MMRMRSWLLGCCLPLFVSTLQAQPFLPPGVLNLGGTIDSAGDFMIHHVIDSDNVVHAVWASEVDYTFNSGPDRDIFYSRLENGVWSLPVLVNSYGVSDAGGNDLRPQIALGFDGSLHCVWDSTASVGGTGADADVFYSSNSGSGWSPAVAVNNYAATDNAAASNSDAYPTIVVTRDGRVVVAWQSNYSVVIGGGPITVDSGTDNDIHYSIRQSGAWSNTQPLNSDAAGSAGDDQGPAALLLLSDDTVCAFWSTDNDFRVLPPVGNDRDIAWSALPPGGDWSGILEISAHARSDTGDDFLPAAIAYGSGLDEEIHVVWYSDDPLDGSGADFDIFHTMLSPFLLVIPPLNETWLVNSTAKTDSPTDADTAPAIAVEPGGVVHCVWESSTDLATGTDLDIYHASNATRGGAWSDMEIVSLTAFVDGAGEDDKAADIAYAPIGVLSVAWESNHNLYGQAGADFDIFHSLGFSRGVSRPEPINTTAPTDSPNPFNDYDQDVEIAVASNGTVHAAWATNHDQIAGGIGTDFDVVYARRDMNGWGPPEPIYPGADSDNAVDWHPAIAVDRQDAVHIVWSSGRDFDGNSPHGGLFHTVNSGSGWSAPKAVQSDTTNNQGRVLGNDYPQLRVSEHGILHLAWLSEFNDFINKGNVAYAYNVGNGWSTPEHVHPQFLSDYSREVQLALDRAGRPHVVWVSNADVDNAGTDNDVFHATRRGAKWTVEPVYEADKESAEDRMPTVAVTPDGIVHVAWASDRSSGTTGADIDLFYAGRDGNSWTAPQLLVRSGQADGALDDDAGPHMVADRNGDLHVVWVNSFPPAGPEPDVSYVRIRPSDGFPSAALVFLANATGYGVPGLSNEFRPRVLIDARGYLHFAWGSQDNLAGVIGDDQDVLYARSNLPLPAGYSGARSWKRYR